MPGFAPAPTSGQGTEPAQFPLHFVSPQAAQQFVVIVVLIVLVWAYWLSNQKKDEDGG
jgi:hypothetical protein